MRFNSNNIASSAAALATCLAASVSATGILLPLYVYPTTEAWAPVLEAVDRYTDQDWNIVINPHNGPGLTGLPGNDDANYIAGVAALNGRSNVNTVGYVRTAWGAASMDELKANISNYAQWAAYEPADVSIHGVFLDEAPADLAHLAYLAEAIQHARAEFRDGVTAVCNFGVAVEPDFYGICDIVIAFESCLNCDGLPQFKGAATLEANVPARFRDQGAVVVNRFAGQDQAGADASTGLLLSYVQEIVQASLGWFYFCAADYNDVGAAPATVGANADALANA